VTLSSQHNHPEHLPHSRLQNPYPDVETGAQRVRCLAKGHTAGRIQTRPELRVDRGTNATAHIVTPQLPQVLSSGMQKVHGENPGDPIPIPLSGHPLSCAGFPESHIRGSQAKVWRKTFQVTGRSEAYVSSIGWRNSKASNVAAVMGQEVRERNRKGDRLGKHGSEGQGQACRACAMGRTWGFLWLSWGDSEMPITPAFV
jgi:hypothetical protein